MTTRSIAELPDIEALFASNGVDGFSHDFAELFAQDEPVLRGGARRVAVFRSADIRAIATHKAAGNMPAELIVERAYLDGAAAATAGAEDRAHISRFFANQVFTSNPPLHAPTRDFFARPLMPKFMPHFVAIADRIVPELIDAVAGQGEIDFGFQFTDLLTARFWAEALGMTSGETDRIVRAVRALNPLFLLQRTRDEFVQTNAAIGAYVDIVSTAVHRSLRDGSNAMLAAMAPEFDAIDVPGKPESIGLSIAANLIDGFHTAALAAANAVYHLLKNPPSLDAVRANPPLVANALAEGLRLSPPVIVTHRYALEPFEYQGVAIPAGTAIAMLWAAGNHHEARSVWARALAADPDNALTLASVRNHAPDLVPPIEGRPASQSGTAI